MSTSSEGVVSKGWIEAARTLSVSPKSKVLCPSCEDGFLEVHDIPYETSAHLRRYMVCSSCSEFNSIRIKK